MIEVDEQVIKGGLAFQQGLFLTQRRIFFPLSQQFGTELQQCLRGGSHFPQFFLGHVGSVLADGGQHLVEHPAFKPFRRGQLAVDDEAVDIAFGNKQELLDTAICRGFHFGNPFAVSVYRFGGYRIPQSPRHIRSAEQILAVFLNDPDRAELRVFENFHLIHVVPPLA